MNERERYLGDGVYASLSIGMIRVRCAAPSETDVCYYEPRTLANLIAFAREVGMITDTKDE